MKKLIQQFYALGRSSTAKHTYWVFGGDGLFTFSTFLTTVIIARGLSIDEFGVFVVLMTVMVLVLDVADLGMGNALSHFVPSFIAEHKKARALQMIKTTLVLETIIGILFMMVSFLLSHQLSYVLFRTDRYAFYIVLMGISFCPAFLTVLLGNALTALQKFPQRALINSLPAVMRLIIVGVLWFMHSLTLQTVTFTLLISFIPSLLLGIVFLGRNIFIEQSSWETAKVLLKFSSFIGLSKGVTAVASRLDVVMLSVLAGIEAAGIYGAASRMTLIYPLLAGSFSAVIAPKLAHMNSSADIRPFMKKISFVTVGLMGSGFLLIILAPFIVPLVFGSRYERAISVFQLLMIPNMIFLATIPTVNFIIYRYKKPQIITLTSIVQLLIIFVANMLFIPQLGRFGPIPGLIMAFGEVFVVTALVTVFALKKITHEKKPPTT